MAYLLGRGSAVEWLRHNRDARIAAPSARWSVPYPALEGSRTRLEQAVGGTGMVRDARSVGGAGLIRDARSVGGTGMVRGARSVGGAESARSTERVRGMGVAGNAGLARGTDPIQGAGSAQHTEPFGGTGPFGGATESGTPLSTRPECSGKLAGLTIPLQLIVWCRNDRRRTAISQSHVLTTQDGFYPAIKVGEDLFVSPPEFTFLQMANILNDEELLFLGYELCGRYGIDGEGVFAREQTCRPCDLTALAEGMPRVRGRRHVLTVAQRVRGGAASPMEAALAIILHTGRELGGYGLEAPELNKALPVEGAARRLWLDDHITPDLLWEWCRLIIEYDSILHHTASERIALDARRRDVFAEMGYRVVTVTTEHMHDPREIDRIAGIVAEALGTDISPRTASEVKVRIAFQKRMLHLAAHPEALLGFNAAV